MRSFFLRSSFERISMLLDVTWLVIRVPARRLFFEKMDGSRPNAVSRLFSIYSN